ncbi:MFS transporter [Agrococcus versicolor]
MSSPSAAPSAVGLRSERGPLLLAMMLSTGLVAIDATILSTAVPTIVDDLGGFASFPWLFSIYLLASSVTTPIYAKLADTIGRKPVMLFGIAAFLVGSLLCGVAWDMPSLIAFRFVQGIGAGAILPVSMTIVGDVYSLEERSRVQGYLASVWAISAVVGPTLGGIFAQLDAWRWIFLVNVPLCLLAAWLVVTRFRERVERTRHRLDWPGALLLTASLSLLILGVLEGGRAWAWASPISIAILGVGAALLAAFVLVERRAAEPILPPLLLTRRLLRVTALMGLAIGGGLIGLTAYVPTYLEGSIGLAPIWAGLALATLTIGWPIAASLSGRLYLRIGFRSTTIIGGVILVVGAGGLAALAGIPSPFIVGALCLLVGLGFGFTAVPSVVAAQASVDWSERGVVTGAQMFSRSIGQAIGAAVLGALANATVDAAGGDATDPATIVSASQVVFVGTAVLSVLVLVAALAMPRDRGAHAASDASSAVAGAPRATAVDPAPAADGA